MPLCRVGVSKIIERASMCAAWLNVALMTGRIYLALIAATGRIEDDREAFGVASLSTEKSIHPLFQ